MYLKRLVPLAVLTCSASLAACGGGGSSITVPATPTVPVPMVTATPVQPVAGSPIQHVIVVVQENRTVDNLFASSSLTSGGAYPGANVATTWTDPLGGSHALSQVPFEYPADPDHSHAALVAEAQQPAGLGFYNNAATGAFGQPNPPAGFVYAEVPYFETILYDTLAARYALSDNTFSTRLVPSFPGHLFIFTGQSDPADDPTDPVNWGCDSFPGTTVGVFNPSAGPEAETTPGPAPCFDYQTIGDLLDAKHVTWKYYTGQIGNHVDAQVNVLDAIKHIRFGSDWTTNLSTPQTNVLSDIQNCNLPQVSFVTPPALASDHAGNASNGGPGWIGSIYLAVAQSSLLQNSKPECQYYLNTAIILTWDDSGGWYDHVAPPIKSDGSQYGFRVPLIVASAYARSGYDPNNPLAPPYVSHTQHEFGSILHYIEKNWNLGSLGTTDVTSDDLSDMFNYSALPVAPISTSAVRVMINKTNWNSVRYKHTNMPVDDDK